MNEEKKISVYTVYLVGHDYNDADLNLASKERKCLLNVQQKGSRVQTANKQKEVLLCERKSILLIL